MICKVPGATFFTHAPMYRPCLDGLSSTYLAIISSPIHAQYVHSWEGFLIVLRTPPWIRDLESESDIATIRPVFSKPFKIIVQLYNNCVSFFMEFTNIISSFLLRAVVLLLQILFYCLLESILRWINCKVLGFF